MNIALWVVQVLLGLLFLFAGGMKLVMTAEQMQPPPGGVVLPLAFLRFIGVVEFLGGLGLLLPGLMGIRPGLTPLAAAGLVIIMIGATVLGLMAGDAVMALIPLAVGLLAAFVAYGRWRLVPHRSRSAQVSRVRP
jgi:uncharacterized membrane protein YphA (DoxX/SURF4 family)